MQRLSHEPERASDPERGPLGPAVVGAASVVRSLTDACGDALVAALLYGSRLTRSSPGRHSAYDMLLVVDGQRKFYRRLKEAGHTRRSPLVMSLFGHVLSPNSVAHRLDQDTLAKCLVVTRRELRRAMSDRARDHFVLGRMVQQVAILHARDAEAEQELREALERGRRTPLRWALPFVEAPFTVREFARGMVAVSYRSEIRPEQNARPHEVVAAQAEFFDRTYAPILEEAVREGLLTESEEGFRPLRAPSWWLVQRLKLYFFSSRVRSTARWVKHVYTFEGWQEYIVRKVERRLGVSVQLTPMERRFPVIFLWPKAVRVLTSKTIPEDRAPPEGDGP